MHYNISVLSLDELQKEIESLGNPQRAQRSAGYFKTGKGEYGEGDIFVGLTVPQSRLIAAKYKDLSLSDIGVLIKSKIHEERFIALLLLINNFRKSNEQYKQEIYDFYLSHTEFINNWDLVDTSAGQIVGAFLREKGNKDITRKVLEKLALSESLWERRIAAISTFEFLSAGECELSLTIADILLYDKCDLIQKAVGWMLREVGKHCSQEIEEEFLRTRYKVMSRTMLRYAIERFSEEKRKKYLHGILT